MWGGGWMKANGKNMKIGHLLHIFHTSQGPWSSPVRLLWNDYSVISHISPHQALWCPCGFFSFFLIYIIMAYLRARKTMFSQIEIPKAFTPVWPQTQRMTRLTSHTPFKALIIFGSQEMLTKEDKMIFYSQQSFLGDSFSCSSTVYMDLNHRETERKINSRQTCHISSR